MNTRKVLWSCTAAAVLASGVVSFAAVYAAQYPESYVGRSMRAAVRVVEYTPFLRRGQSVQADPGTVSGGPIAVSNITPHKTGNEHFEVVHVIPDAEEASEAPPSPPVITSEEPPVSGAGTWKATRLPGEIVIHEAAPRMLPDGLTEPDPCEKEGADRFEVQGLWVKQETFEPESSVVRCPKEMPACREYHPGTPSVMPAARVWEAEEGIRFEPVIMPASFTEPVDSGVCPAILPAGFEAKGTTCPGPKCPVAGRCNMKASTCCGECEFVRGVCGFFVTMHRSLECWVASLASGSAVAEEAAETTGPERSCPCPQCPACPFGGSAPPAMPSTIEFIHPEVGTPKGTGTEKSEDASRKPFAPVSPKTGMRLTDDCRPGGIVDTTECRPSDLIFGIRTFPIPY